MCKDFDQPPTDWNGLTLRGQMESTNRHVLISTLVVTAGYMLSRSLIYRTFGPLESIEDWFVRDTLMSFPRILGFFSCLWIACKNGGTRRWGWNLHLSRCGIV